MDGPFSFLVLYGSARWQSTLSILRLLCPRWSSKGQHIKLGKLVAKPFSNWKNAIKLFNEHAGHIFHLAATMWAQNFISIFKNKKKGVFESLDSGRKAQALQNRAKLNLIVKTVIFCGHQGIPLRGHADMGTLALPDNNPVVNDGKFCALLRF
jgi:hypothetical protein